MADLAAMDFRVQYQALQFIMPVAVALAHKVARALLVV
jgi:hypothetical protein